MKREFHDRGDHVLIVATGDFDLDEAVARLGDIFQACRHWGRDRVLMDTRGLEGEMDTTQEMAYASGWARHYQAHLGAGGHPLRMAFVGNAPFIKTWQPGINLAKKEGMDAHATTDMEEALEWLRR
jgi:hypothetical protein